jgi:hypothetical protein
MAQEKLLLVKLPAFVVASELLPRLSSQMIKKTAGATSGHNSWRKKVSSSCQCSIPTV